MKSIAGRARARIDQRKRQRASRARWQAFGQWAGIAALAAIALPGAALLGLALAMSARAMGGDL